MTYKLPNDTKDYLLFMIENRIENNPQDFVFNNSLVVIVYDVDFVGC